MSSGPEIDWLAAARAAMEIEAESIRRASARLDGELIRAVDLVLAHPGKVIVTGIGKSGHIARKIVATLCSTGTAAVFLHPAEAVHGDLGIYTPGDPTVLISNRGASAELQALVPLLRQFRSPLIGILGNLASPLAGSDGRSAGCVGGARSRSAQSGADGKRGDGAGAWSRVGHCVDVRAEFHPGGVRAVPSRRATGAQSAVERGGGDAHGRRSGVGGARHGIKGCDHRDDPSSAGRGVRRGGRRDAGGFPDRRRSAAGADQSRRHPHPAGRGCDDARRR